MRKWTPINTAIAAIILLSYPGVPARADGPFENAGTCDIALGYPATIAITDFDDDGDKDLIVLRGDSAEVSIYLNRGGGSFDNPETHTIYDDTTAFAVADMDGDGDNDLTFAQLGQKVYLLLNNGDGTFTTTAQTQVYASGLIACGDIDGDGDVDAIAANASSSLLSILKNNGDATFAAALRVSAGCYPGSLALLDLSGDGMPELAMTSPQTGDVAVMLNNGSGSLAYRVMYPAGDEIDAAESADLDGDGDTDFVALDISTQSVSILFNQGDGTFVSGQTLLAGVDPSDIALGDLDDDADVDLVVWDEGLSSNRQSGVKIYRNQGNGDFVYSSEKYAAPYSRAEVWTWDHDADGDIDVLVSGSPRNVQMGDAISILVNNGDGQLEGIRKTGFYGSPTITGVGDFDLDGRIDFARADEYASCVHIAKGGADGWFEEPTSWAVQTQFPPNTVSVMDMNFDTRQDLVTLSVDSRAIEVQLNQGDGTFLQAASTTISSPSSSSRILLNDLDGDKDIDAIVTRSSSFQTFFNNGYHSFTPGETYSADSGVSSLRAADLDGDGDIDLAMPYSLERINIRLNAGDGTFGAPIPLVPQLDSYINSVVVCDVDGDGLNDLIIRRASGQPFLLVMRNNGDGTYEETDYAYLPYSPYSTLTCMFTDVTPADVDDDGDVDLVVVEQRYSFVTLFINDGNGVFAATEPYQVGYYPAAIVPADLNGDNRLDLAVLCLVYEDIFLLYNNHTRPDSTPNQLIIHGPTYDQALTRRKAPVRVKVLGNFAPIACRHIECTRLSGEFTFTSGTTIAGDEDRRRIATNGDGEAIIGVQANVAGVGLIGFSVPGTNLPMAYCVVNFHGPYDSDPDMQPQIGGQSDAPLKAAERTPQTTPQQPGVRNTLLQPAGD